MICKRVIQTPTPFQHAVTLFQEGKLEQAQALCERALAHTPGDADWWHLHGVVATHRQQYAAAIGHIEKAIALNPANAHFHSNLGNAHKRRRSLDDALACYERAIALMPDFAEFHYNRGCALDECARLEAALACYDRAIELKPAYGPAWNNRGKVHHALKRFDDAARDSRQAIALMPHSPEAHNNLASALSAMKRHKEALICWQRAMALAPHLEFAAGNAAHMRAFMCDWSGRDDEIAALRAGIRAGAAVISPFPLLALVDDPALHRQAAETYVRSKLAPPRLPPLRNSTMLDSLRGDSPVLDSPVLDSLRGDSPRDDSSPRHSRHDGKIHIAYLSADFHDHATAHLMAELFERHDRSRFELTALSFGPDKRDALRARVAAAFDRFIDVRGLSDAEAASRCRQMGVDIAVDLKGYTEDARPGILAERCAPIQVNYLGYPGTMGADFIDYIVADRRLIAEDDLPHYTEKVLWLPGSYQPNDRQRVISETTPTRAECGLPENAFVFCCFNNNYKIAPATFDSWMRILKRVPGSALWLLEGNPTAALNLKREALARGVAPARLIFARPLPSPDHLARHRLADLFIDTLPCNAHTTASDALWAGLPVLTLMGRSLQGRVAASLLDAAGLPELIVTTPAAYEDLAVELAHDSQRLAAMKAQLAATRMSCALFDSTRHTRNLEQAFMRAVERHRAGLPPGHMAIGAVP